MQTYLITWKTPDAKTQFEAGKAFVKWFDNKEFENDPKGFKRLGWCSLIQNGTGVSIVQAESLKILWEVYGKWRKLGLDIEIQPAATMNEAADFFR